MPTILRRSGWRLFFYSNEGNEPAHIHCQKGGMECKYWIGVNKFDIQEDYAFALAPRDRRQIRKIIFEHYDYIMDKWYEFQKRRQ